MTLLLHATALGVLVLGTATSVFAQAEQDQARQHFETGRAHYDQGEYEQALREFERSQSLSGRVELFYNISLARQQLGQLDEAASALETYLSSGEVTEDDREVLGRRLENLRRRSREQQETAESANTPTTSDSETNVPAVIAFAVAGAGLLTGASFLLVALSEDGRLEDQCSPCQEDDLSTLRTFTLLTDVGFAVSLVSAGVGLTFLLLGGEDEPETSLAPIFGQGLAGLSVRGQL